MLALVVFAVVPSLIDWSSFAARELNMGKGTPVLIERHGMMHPSRVTSRAWNGLRARLLWLPLACLDEAVLHSLLLRWVQL